MNKVDILAERGEVEQVLQFVREHGAALLGESRQVFAVSARAALGDGADGDQALWQRSGFAGVERYLLETLDQEERVRLKLLNPLNVALRLAGTYREAAYERLRLLAEDVQTLANIDRQLAAFHEEMLRDFEPRLARLELLLNDMEARGLGFFDEHVRIGRIRGLLSWWARSAARSPTTARRCWTPSGACPRTWSAATTARPSRGRCQRGPRRLRHHRPGKGRRRRLGTALVIALGGAAADFTGVLLASTLAVGGLYVIPQKRRKVQADFRQRMAQLRARLTESLTRQVHREIADSAERINQAIAPYRRFVQTQQQSLNEARDELVVTEEALKRLRGELERP